MRNKLLVLLITALTLAFIQPLALAAVKPGTACKVLGKTSTSSGIKYTCIKSGKKLLWNKGTTIKKVADFKQGICPPASPADQKEITQSRANALVSMSEDQGQQCSELLGWAYRVGQRDDEYSLIFKSPEILYSP